MKTKSHKKGSVVFGSKSIISTMVLFLCIGIISVLLSVHLNRLAEKQCYSVLTSSTNVVLNNIESNFRSDRNSLRMLSRVIALENDLQSDTTNHLLTTYDVSSMVTNIAIITPDGTIMPVRGEKMSSEGIMDYEEEKKLGEHMSGLQPSLNNANTYVIRSFVPVKKSGKVIAMLFIEMNPSAIANAWTPDIYDGSADFCIVDRSSGDFIVDSRDEPVSNVSELNGTSLADNLMNGETGFLEMKSHAGDNIFVSYMPMEIANWQIVITVGKSDVFSFVNQMRQSMKMFLFGGAVILVLYLLWLLYSNHRSILAAEKSANIDVLTGLQNRNRYEIFCKGLEKEREGTICIYIDANGLHEINNTQGHLAGDRMLRFIADALKVRFGEDGVYRIGGDEFVVFCQDSKRNKIEKILDSIHEEMARNNYHISAGYTTCDSSMTVSELIKSAETKMYEAKKKYYESIGKEVRNAQQPDKKE